MLLVRFKDESKGYHQFVGVRSVLFGETIIEVIGKKYTDPTKGMVREEYKKVDLGDMIWNNEGE